MPRAHTRLRVCVDNAAAQTAYGSSYTITADQLAAGLIGTGGKDSCQGDSGGPLVVKDASGAWKLGGVVIWGIGCADPAYPGLYARASSFQSWIAGQISGTTPPPTTTRLTNGQTVIAVGAASGAWVNYSIDVPAGATNLVVNMSGGTGDGDLYVKSAAPPPPRATTAVPTRAATPGAARSRRPRPAPTASPSMATPPSRVRPSPPRNPRAAAARGTRASSSPGRT